MRLDRILDHYHSRIDPTRESFDVLDWGSRTEQEARFRVLRDALFEEGIADPSAGRELSILDVGCGLGDLHGFLGEHVDELRYVGVDISPALLREARTRRRDTHFVLADVFRAPPFRARQFDIVFCSGVFNLKLGNNEEFAAAALPRLYDLCARAVMVNFLHERTQERYEHCWYYSPRQLVAALPERMRHVRVIDDYLDKDFSLLVKRPPADTA